MNGTGFLQNERDGKNYGNGKSLKLNPSNAATLES